MSGREARREDGAGAGLTGLMPLKRGKQLTAGNRRGKGLCGVEGDGKGRGVKLAGGRMDGPSPKGGPPWH